MRLGPVEGSRNGEELAEEHMVEVEEVFVLWGEILIVSSFQPCRFLENIS